MIECLVEVTASNVQTKDQMFTIAGVALMILGSVESAEYHTKNNLLVIKTGCSLSSREDTKAIESGLFSGLMGYDNLGGVTVLCHFIDPTSQVASGSIH